MSVKKTHRSPVMQVHGLPVWIVPRIERSPILIEFVRKYKDKLFVRLPALLRVYVPWSVFVYQTMIPWEHGNLAGSVDSAKVETPLQALGPGR